MITLTYVYDRRSVYLGMASLFAILNLSIGQETTKVTVPINLTLTNFSSPTPHLQSVETTQLTSSKSVSLASNLTSNSNSTLATADATTTIEILVKLNATTYSNNDSSSTTTHATLVPTTSQASSSNLTLVFDNNSSNSSSSLSFSNRQPVKLVNVPNKSSPPLQSKLIFFMMSFLSFILF